MDARIVNKRALESLIKVGALDGFGRRPTLLAALDRIVSFSADHHKAKETGQMSLFGEETGVSFGAQESILASLHDVDAISKREMLNWERDLVGLYVTDHPLKSVMAQLQKVITHTSAELTEVGEAANGLAVTIAGLDFGIVHAPGHTEGSVMFTLADVPEGINVEVGSTVVSGDVLFAGSIGRSDLPGGDERAMNRSLRDCILPMPDDRLVLPGHGPLTTIGRERRSNPFLRGLA